MLNQTSPTPSPSRRRRTNASPSQNSAGFGLGIQVPSDDEDEETLQLQLQEIQAKLRLKKLQSARAKESASGSSILTGTESERTAQFSPGSRANLRSPVQHHQNPIEVPASPVRRLQAPQQQTSPSRVLLGIDKGLTAKDVSLKRAPSHKRLNSKTSLQSGSSRDQPQSEAARPSTFNDRLAAMRTEEAFRKERQAKIQSVRSNAFGIGRDEMDKYKETAVEIPDEPLAPPVFSRDEILGRRQPRAGNIPHSKTAPVGRLNQEETGDVFSSSSKGASKETEQASFEAYSCFHLSRRILPHNVITRHVSGKKIFSIKDLLRDVKGPDFSLPDIEQDLVVFGILAKKSEPRQHKPTTGKAGKKEEERGKYMVMTLTDLDFELDLFLFNSGFTRFYKLTEGTVVAILNPNIMPPPPGRQDTGRFSLVINSDEDTILEVGMARDLGFCKSVRKDGNSCGSWVNKKKTEFCEFHSNEAVRKQKGTRVEMNTSGFGRKQEGGRGGGGSRDHQQDKFKGNNNDWAPKSQSQWFVSRSMSAADLIDGKDLTSGDRKERAEFLKRSLEAKEKEREIMKRLGQVGNAAGKDYMRFAGSRAPNDKAPIAGQSSQANRRGEDQPVTDAASLGMLRGDRAIHLSPVKRKREDSSQASSVAASSRSTPYGWGGGLKDKLSSMKSGESFLNRKKSTSPVRKKTRFVTSKGIREAGRESLGNELSQRQVSLDDDDDDEELVILQ